METTIVVKNVRAISYRVSDLQLKLDNTLGIIAILEYWPETIGANAKKKAFSVNDRSFVFGLQELRYLAEMFLHDLDIPVE